MLDAILDAKSDQKLTQHATFGKMDLGVRLVFRDQTTDLHKSKFQPTHIVTSVLDAVLAAKVTQHRNTWLESRHGSGSQ